MADWKWDVLEPVQVKVDARELQALGLALRVLPDRTIEIMGPIVRRHGRQIDEEVAANLSGRVLNVRSGEGRGSWEGGMTGPMSWEGENEQGYMSLWETGFTASPGHFPARGKRVVGKWVPGKDSKLITVIDEMNPGLPSGTIEKRGPGDWWMHASGKAYPMVWLRTTGGPRAARPWAQPALDAVTPGFLQDVHRGLVHVWTGLK
jgi:hypothetical protein